MHLDSRKQRMKRKERMRRRKIMWLFFIGIVIISIPFIDIMKHDTKSLEIVQADDSSNLDDKSEIKSDNKEQNNESNIYTSSNIHKNTLDNSGYLELKDDPNADDASIISKNISDLLKGNKNYPVRTDGKKVAYLTFDDGPSTTNTPNILKVLDQYNIKGTFFIVGKTLENNEEAKKLLKEIAKDGHAIGNHTYSHNYKYLYPNGTINVDNIINDLNKNDSLMKSILGKDFSSRVIRLPGGYWSWNGRTNLKNKLVELGLESIDWNALNGDAEGKKKNEDELFARFKETVDNLGENADSITILMHDTYGKENTVKTLPRIIEYLKERGFEFRTIK